MTEDIRATGRGQTEAHALEPWVAPALTDLGSFGDLTRFNPVGTTPDAEGFS